ncbi:MAG: hypothetical protein KAS32_11030 [Candidatus Peribacteraceae bacterium]|nr:hypothetical protein [Candidatus Peribacteraceae bacterium]
MVKRVRKPIGEIMGKSSQGSGMKCPKCHAIQFSDGKKNVIETRRTTGGTIRRRRECRACGKRFTTIERTV